MSLIKTITREESEDILTCQFCGENVEKVIIGC